MKQHLPLRRQFSAIILGCFLFCNLVNAQYVTLPDTNFVAALDSLGYGSCLNGDQLDTTCPAVLQARLIDLTFFQNGIKDLTGIQYFKALDTLVAPQGGNVRFIPAFPPSLTYLQLAWNDSLDSIPALPASLIFLNVNYCNLSSLPALPDSLQTLWCQWNVLTTLPALPPGLITLIANDNQLASLPALPNTRSLWELRVSGNYLSGLPALPAGLNELDCAFNFLDSLPALPQSLQILEFGDTDFVAIPVLPDSITNLIIWNTKFHSFSFNWPSMIGSFTCGSNQLDSLPYLPSTITFLDCDNNNLTFIRSLPPNLTTIDFSSNNITTIPAFFPSTLNYLVCDNNQLSSIPPLPGPMLTFTCSNNPSLYCLPAWDTVGTLNFSNTAISCVPMYSHVGSSTPALNTMPLCAAGNANGCPSQWNMSGQAFTDTGNTCQYVPGENVFTNVKIKLWQNGALLEQAFTDPGGYYSFNAGTSGIYAITVDTTALPFTLLCPLSDMRIDTITATDSMQLHQDFALACPSGFDLGAWSIA